MDKSEISRVKKIAVAVNSALRWPNGDVAGVGGTIDACHLAGSAFPFAPRIFIDKAVVAAMLVAFAGQPTPVFSKALEPLPVIQRRVALPVATREISLAPPMASEAVAATDAASTPQPRRAVVVVDSTVADYQTLIAGIDPMTPVIVLQPGKSGLSVLAEALIGYRDLDAVHLVTEGHGGAIQLGAQWVDAAALQADPSDIRAIAAAVKPGGDLLLYGCSVAHSEAGEKFVAKLAQMLGHVDVAASSNPTGPTRLGGDWELEHRHGAIQIILPFTQMGMQGIGHNLAAGDLCTDHYYGSRARNTITRNSDSQELVFYDTNNSGWYASVQITVTAILQINALNNATGLISNSLSNMPASMADIRKQIAECSAASNTAPTFVGATTTLTVAQSASATDLKSLLHVSDSDSGQTETWTQSSAPSHGTLTISGATASSGSADLTPGGTLTYTPTAGYAGADSFTVQVSDGTASAARTISVTVSAPTVTVSALTLNSMTVGTLFTPQSFSGAGGTGTYTYSVSAGLLPAGLSLDASSGALTGTPTTAGAYSFTIQTTDSSTGTSAPFSGTRAFSGSVAAAAAGACDSSSDGQTLTSAPSALCASGSASSVTSGNTLYTWTCAGGGAPASCSATRHYLVTPSAGTNGSLSPSAAQSVAYNATPSFTASPSSGHDLQSVSGCAGSLSGSSYTTGAITADCTVAARFSYRVRLNDTGASQCYDGSGLAACSRANSGNAAAHPRQDGRFGRDAAQAAGQLAAKTGGGAAGFDFTPLDASGTVLALTGAPPVPSATPACTRDNVTGLLWEVKTAANKANLYSFAATAAYASAANSASLCGASSGWRLPSRRELLSLVHHGASNPAIDGDYFPNTDSSGYWTGDPYAVPASTSVWKVDFYTGEAAEQDPAGTIRARLVRSGP